MVLWVGTCASEAYSVGSFVLGMAGVRDDGPP